MKIQSVETEINAIPVMSVCEGVVGLGLWRAVRSKMRHLEIMYPHVQWVEEPAGLLRHRFTVYGSPTAIQRINNELSQMAGFQ